MRESQKGRVRAPGMKFNTKGRTHQSFKDECDINKIMGKWRQVGFIEHVSLKRPVYEDFSNAEDYMSTLNKIQAAKDLFASLPARLRARVNNNPADLINFVHNPNNADELRELGLLNPIEDREDSPSEPAAAEPTDQPPGGETPHSP